MEFRFVLFGPNDDPDANRRAAEAAATAGEPTSGLYSERNGGIVRLTGERSRTIPVTNFLARITSDVVLDDGEDEQRFFGLEAESGGQKLTFTVSAAEFSRMAWVLGKLGPKAIVYPGQQQHARAAIQSLSNEVHAKRIYTHLGWRRRGEEWVYLHGGGTIGANGPVAGGEVALPAQLAGYELRLPADPESRGRAVRATRRMLDMAPDAITFPLVAALFRAALGEVDFSLFLTGRTGVFKTAIAAVAQQHFGARIRPGALPGNFSSTGNALELLAFHAKDALFVVDDFAPTGSARDSELHAVAERLFRAAGNGQGRSRMSADGRLQPQKAPRGLVLATGEEGPTGQSIRARMLILEVAPGDVNVGVLSECQRSAAAGLFSETMGAFLRWVAGRYEQIEERRRKRVIELRSALGHAAHSRTPGMIAELQTGFEIFLEFAAEIGAITPAEKADLENRAVQALHVAAVGQLKYQQASDPAVRFLSLLRAALACGRAHVAARQGGAPAPAEEWGWHPNGSGGWSPRGIRLGWVDGEHLYLEPASSYSVAQSLGSERIPISEQTLRLRLNERGLLASVDKVRETLKVRRMIEGRPREVLHLRAGDALGADGCEPVA